MTGFTPLKNIVNERLRYAIEVLQGEHFKTYPENRILFAINEKRTFEAWGFWWQAKILGHHINKARAQLKVEHEAETFTPASAGDPSPTGDGASSIKLHAYITRESGYHVT